MSTKNDFVPFALVFLTIASAVAVGPPWDLYIFRAVFWIVCALAMLASILQHPK